MRLVLVFVAIIGLTSCAPKEPHYSGFLGDPSVYQQLNPHPQYEGVRVLRKGDVPFSHYRKLIVPPVKLYMKGEDYARYIDQKDLNELAIMFHNKIVEAATPYYQITNIPADNAIILRVALTDADPYLPIDNYNLATRFGFKEEGIATMEFEFVDSISGVTILAGIATKEAKRYDRVGGLSKWGQVENALNDWAQILRLRFEEEAKLRQ